MKRVSEVDSLRIGKHVRFVRLGAAPGQDGSTVVGECVGHREDGSAIIRKYDGTETWFSYERGDRLQKLTGSVIKSPREQASEPPPTIERTHFHRERLKFRVAAGFAGAGLVASVGLVAAIVLKLI